MGSADPGQHGGRQVLSRRLAHAAGDPDHLGLGGVSGCRAQRPERHRRVRYPYGRPRTGRAGGQVGAGAGLHCRLDEIVAVSFSDQRDEQTAGGRGPRVLSGTVQQDVLTNQIAANSHGSLRCPKPHET